MAGGVDPFVKIRGPTQGVTEKPEKEAGEESTEKAFCDKGMAKTTSKNGVVAKLTSKIDQDSSKPARLKDEAKEAQSEFAALAKEQAEMDKIYREENAGYTKAKLLKDFYAAAGGSFVQYVPPNSDREGKTFGDRAPDVFDSSGYKGQLTGSKVIVGMLEVILSDFDRTIDTTNTNEAEAQAEFEMFEEDTKNDVAAKKKSTDQKEDRITEIKDELTAGKDSIKEQNQLLETAEAALQELKTQCVDGEETYADRVAKREKEIESLKEALNILIEWQGF